jgi:hypothetical protein
MLTKIQKKKFLEISGHEYSGDNLKGSFATNRAYNDKKWEKHSPWIFSYIIDYQNEYLVCELAHRMTNERVYGWDKEGNSLKQQILDKYFPPNSMFKIMNSNGNK